MYFELLMWSKDAKQATVNHLNSFVSYPPPFPLFEKLATVFKKPVLNFSLAEKVYVVHDSAHLCILIDQNQLYLSLNNCQTCQILKQNVIDNVSFFQ